MANLSNINNILRTGSLGVGINRDPASPFEVSSATKPGIKMFNTATNGKTYQAYSDENGNYIIYDEDADDNRFIINTSGNATFSGSIIATSANLTTSGTVLSLDRTGGATALIELKIGGTIEGYLGATTTKSLVVFNESAAEKFSVSNAGDGTFAGSITSTGLNVNAGTYHKVIATFPATYTTNLQIGQQFNVNNDALTDTVTFAHTGTEAASDFIFTVAGNEKLKIQGNGNATFTGNVSVIGSAKFIEVGSANTGTNFGFMGWNAASKYLFLGNSYNSVYNENLVINSSGNVGIGSTNPTSISANTFSLSVGSARNDLSGAIVYQANGTIKSQMYWDSSGLQTVVSSGDVRWYTGGVNDRMRITSAGDVGIGTDSPSNKLDVKISTSNRTTLEPVLTVSAEGSGPYTGFGPKISFNSNIYYGAATGNPAGIIETAYIGAVMGTTYATNSDLVLATRDGATSVTEKMRILGNGNVGIGTSSPVAKFEVTDGSSSITLQEYTNGAAIFLDGVNGDFIGGDYFHILADGNSYLGLGGYGGGATPLNVANSGNVGIGTTSPTRQLHLKRTSGDVRGIMVETTVAASYAEVQVKAAREFRIGTGGSSSDSNASDRFYIFDATAAAHRFTISSTGNVGIGTTSPAQKVEIAGGYLKFSGGDYGIQGSASLTYNPVSDHYFQASGSTKVTIKASGNVGIGETNPQRPLHINGTEGVARFTSTASGNNGFEVGIGTSSQAFLWQAENSYMQFATNNTERMRITSGGDVLISKTSASFTTQGIELRENGQINVAGTVDEFNFYNTSAAAYRFFVTAAGSVHATSTSIVAISDITLKENIKPLETGLNEVMKLKPRRFDWKNGDGKNIAGFIAQEVEEVLPDLVSDYKYTDEETKKALKMGDMIPTLVKSIQELKAEIELLKSK